MDFKVCSKCGEPKELQCFYANKCGTFGRYSVCKKCCAAKDQPKRARNPVQYKARAALNNALASGAITRHPCEVCGESVAQAHHDDYSRPLEVRWLCITHHAEWHRHNTAKFPDQEAA